MEQSDNVYLNILFFSSKYRNLDKNASYFFYLAFVCWNRIRDDVFGSFFYEFQVKYNLKFRLFLSRMFTIYLTFLSVDVYITLLEYILWHKIYMTVVKLKATYKALNSLLCTRGSYHGFLFLFTVIECIVNNYVSSRCVRFARSI